MHEPEPIYVIVADNGYGMTIKLEKARKIAQYLLNSFVVKFSDAMSGYVWLSSQINDYTEDYYNSTRVLTKDDLVSLDDLIREQYVAISDSELKRRNCKRIMDINGVLHIGLGETCEKKRLAQNGYDSDVGDEMENAARTFLKTMEKHKLKKR